MVTPRTSQKGKTCAVDGCGTPARKQGWCGKHYAMRRRTGDPTTPPKWTLAARGGRCVVCDSPDLMAKSRKFCSKRCQMRESFARRGISPLATTQFICCVRCGCTIDLFKPGIAHSTTRISTAGRKRRADTRLCADCRRQNGYRHGWSAQALAARDGTDCGICGDFVDMTLRNPDSMSASVDHVVSCADGGSDDPSNLQLAHLTCNHRKARRSGWTAR